MTNAVVALAVPSKTGTLIADELVTDQGVYGMVDLAKVRPSPDNRKRFNEQALQELAASIRSMGVAQPILIRPVTPTAEAPEEFEIVAGERRFRASKIAGNTEIPALRRNLSDLDAAKIRILENLQREDPHPMEEAEGYQLLMLRHGFTADQVAYEVNRSRAYVYGRLKLCALTTAVREQFLDNKLTPSTALLIARIPVPALQVKAAQEILTPNWQGDTLSYRQAAIHVQNRYMLNLSTAIFSVTDAKLLAAAGACTKCPKRAGNQPEVFEGVDANVCTDPDCFAEKKAAHYNAMITAANKKGIPVHEGDEAAALFSNAWDSSSELIQANVGLNRFARNAPSTKNGGYVNDYLNSETLPPVAVYARRNDSEVTAFYRRADVQQALEVAGACETIETHAERMRALQEDPSLAPPKTARQLKQEQDEQERRAAQAVADQETTYRLAVYKQLRLRAGVAGLSLPSMREYVKAVLENYGLDSALHDLYETDVSTDLDSYIDNADAGALQLLLIDAVLGSVLAVNWYFAKHGDDDDFATVKAMARHEGIDVEAVRAEFFPPVLDEPTEQAAPTPAAAEHAAIDVTPAEPPTTEQEAPKLSFHGIQKDGLVAYIRANPEHLDTLTKSVLAHPRGELVGLLEQAANSLGYTYAEGGTWVVDPVLATENAAPVDQVEQAATPAAADQVELQQPATHDDAEDLAEQLATVETAKPSTKQPAAKTAKAKSTTKSKPTPAPAATYAASPWPFPKTSDGKRPPAAESPANEKN